MVFDRWMLQSRTFARKHSCDGQICKLIRRPTKRRMRLSIITRMVQPVRLSVGYFRRGRGVSRRDSGPSRKYGRMFPWKENLYVSRAVPERHPLRYRSVWDSRRFVKKEETWWRCAVGGGGMGVEWGGIDRGEPDRRWSKEDCNR